MKVMNVMRDGKGRVPGKVRQKTWVSRLVLTVEGSSVLRLEGKQRVGVKKVVCVDGDIGPITLRVIAGIVMTEITGIGVAVAVVVIWRTAWMVLWLVPLVLKLVSAVCCVPREPLVVTDDDVPGVGATGEKREREGVKRFLISSRHGFQVIEGPARLVQQFFRHYGHPRRSRWNELVQIGVVIAFGLNFPVGLVVSTMWMPIGLQCVWTAYVLYVTIAMYISRYAHAPWWLTTEEKIAEALIDAEEHPGEVLVLFKGGDDCTMRLDLTRTIHNSYGEAKAHALQLVQSPQLPPSWHQARNGSQSVSSNAETLTP
ncbi:hypothetical protein AbraCBS73388_000649 [Aspergillus brasiliensis]|uniref:Uncharacterized protein n=1 Tax=Aspergillus brasiliensis TaxID=319629 RepID=A0A9W5YWS6_9EURO|nr:hypothetical protein AbraCBS73388_000649 [Aspergillus brasiliensis]